MELRLAEAADVKAVTELRMKYFDDVYAAVMTEEDRAELKKKNIEIACEELGRSLYIAAVFEDGRCVAESYMTVVRKAANLRFREGIYGEIYGVFTDDDFRRRGYADMNIRLLIEKGRELGLSYIELEASPDGVKLYEQNGFTYVNAEYKRMQYEFQKGVIL